MSFASPGNAFLVPAPIQRLWELEIGFMRQRNAAIEQMLTGQPVPIDVVRVVTDTLLPQCQRARESLEAPSSNAMSVVERGLWTYYIDLHARAWEAFVRALQVWDLTQIRRHEQLLAEAQRLLQQAAPPSVAPQADSLREFRQLLLSLTPRVWVVPAIVILNIAVWVAMVLAGAGIFLPPTRMMLAWGANFGALTLDGQWWRIISCMFLHFGLLHLGFNMYVLWQLGRPVELLVGNAGVIVLYLASGIAASIASLAWNPMPVSAGASGAVFGVCGALLGFIVLRRDTIPKTLLLDLRGSLLTFVVYNVAFGAVVPAIDMAAHLGGLVYGFSCGVLLSQPLVPGAQRTRWRRNLLCLVGSAILLPLAFSQLPAPPPLLPAAVVGPPANVPPGGTGRHVPVSRTCVTDRADRTALPPDQGPPHRPAGHRDRTGTAAAVPPGLRTAAVGAEPARRSSRPAVPGRAYGVR
jgi:membrane associated rhomboid family serine protease